MQFGDLFYKLGIEPDFGGIRDKVASIGNALGFAAAQIAEPAVKAGGSIAETQKAISNVNNVLTKALTPLTKSFVTAVNKNYSSYEFNNHVTEARNVISNVNNAAAKALMPLSQTFGNVSKEMNTVFSTNEFKNSVKSAKDIVEKSGVYNLTTKITNSESAKPVNLSEFIGKNILDMDFGKFSQISKEYVNTANSASRLDNIVKSEKSSSLANIKERIKTEAAHREKDKGITNNNNITINVHGKTEDVSAITEAVKIALERAEQNNDRQMMGEY